MPPLGTREYHLGHRYHQNTETPQLLRDPHTKRTSVYGSTKGGISPKTGDGGNVSVNVGAPAAYSSLYTLC